VEPLISQIRNLNAKRLDLSQIRAEVVASEQDFFLAYMAAKLLSGWKTESDIEDAQSFYEDLFG